MLIKQNISWSVEMIDDAPMCRVALFCLKALYSVTVAARGREEKLVEG